MNRRFIDLDRKFELQGTQINDIRGLLTTVLGEVNTLTDKVEYLNRKFNEVNGRVDSIEQDVNLIKGKLAHISGGTDRCLRGSNICYESEQCSSADVWRVGLHEKGE